MDIARRRVRDGVLVGRNREEEEEEDEVDAAEVRISSLFFLWERRTMLMIRDLGSGLGFCRSE